MSHVRTGRDIIEIHFQVEPELHGLRVDLFLKKKIPRLSRTRIQRIIETQLEGPGGRRMKPHSPVAVGDELVIRRPAKPEPDAPTEFGIVYEDEALLVVDKPALLTMHPSAKYHFNTLTQLLGERYPDEQLYTTHRLDRETSGIVVVARNLAAAARMKNAFERRQVHKRYLAVCVGAPADDEGLIDQPLALAAGERVSIKMLPRAGGLSAQTRWRVLGRRAGHSLIQAMPLTGRQHQIRAHLAHIGLPLVGDKLYGAGGDAAFTQFWDGGWTDELRALFVLERHALHAHGIDFPHPQTGALLSLESPLPADLSDFWDGLSSSA